MNIPMKFICWTIIALFSYTMALYFSPWWGVLGMIGNFGQLFALIEMTDVEY